MISNHCLLGKNSSLYILTGQPITYPRTNIFIYRVTELRCLSGLTTGPFVLLIAKYLRTTSFGSAPPHTTGNLVPSGRVTGELCASREGSNFQLMATLLRNEAA